MNVDYAPWYKILISFILGILLGYSYDINTKYTWIILPILIFYILLNIFYKKYNKTILNIFSSIIVFIFALLYTQYFKLNNQAIHFSKQQAEYAIGYIHQAIEEKEKSYKSALVIESIINKNKEIVQANGKLLVYTQKTDNIKQLNIGDKVFIKLNPKQIDEPRNIGQFNYKNYLALDEIYHQTYVKENELKFITHTNKYLLKKWSNNLSIMMQNLLRKYIPKEQNFALADGILLGHRAEIDSELYASFSQIGIVHILSVSGLHVGIIYLLISFLLRFIPNRNFTIRFSKFIVAALLIWLFAFVVGLSPAVVRAAILFSLLNFGKIIKEDASSINMLFGAAFLQLLFEPLLIYNIGFQLSYLAMLGLFTFYKPIYGLFYTSNKIADYVWQLWAASIAAQIFTTPLVIYYFGNFPTYFLFANIFAIPLSSVILWSSIALLPFSFVPFLAKYIGCFTSLCIDIFIWCTEKIASLPFAKIDYLYINFYQVLLMFVVAILLFVFINRLKYKYLIYAISVAIIIVLSTYYTTYDNYKKDKIILYNLKNNLAISYQHKDKFDLYYYNPISAKDYNFNIHNAFRQCYGRQKNTKPLESKTLQFDNKLFYILDNHQYKNFSSTIEVDYLIVSNNIYLDLNIIKDKFNFKQMIIACNNDYRHQNIYKKILKQQNIDFIDLNDKYLIITI